MTPGEFLEKWLRRDPSKGLEEVIGVTSEMGWDLLAVVQGERDRCAKIVRECDCGGPGGDPQGCNCKALLEKIANP